MENLQGEVLQGVIGDHIPMDSNLPEVTLNDPSLGNSGKRKRKGGDGQQHGNSAGFGNRRPTLPRAARVKDPNQPLPSAIARKFRRKKGEQGHLQVPEGKEGDTYLLGRHKRLVGAAAGSSRGRAGVVGVGRGQEGGRVQSWVAEKVDVVGSPVEIEGQEEVHVEYVPYSPPHTRRSGGRVAPPLAMLRRCFFEVRRSERSLLGEVDGGYVQDAVPGGRGDASFIDCAGFNRSREIGNEHGRDTRKRGGIQRSATGATTLWRA
ncbi:hypothetical protein KC19_VG246000 [Ceratodon purpureus]|uniref:Uncharacterized protein n=1 Tax=Ceratodon purpureus TaxID=3225 RepID=A0A8T0HT97_CERPU|nr:hypothetical protein KC19_VG246000 [Ceratodon purpureus]